MTNRHFLNAMAAVVILLAAVFTNANAGNRYNFNAGWKLSVGENADGASLKLNDSKWHGVTLPYAFNQAEAYSRNCADLSDTVMWYRKHFVLPKEAKGKKVFIEFEGVRFGARVFLNGNELGLHENGVMAFGFDLTPYIKYKGENILAVFVDNSWQYREHVGVVGPDGKTTYSRFQWNDKNFYCNYGGINKNVWLHIMDNVYQTLPLYSNLGTTGVYVYPSDFTVSGKNGSSATVNVEAQVVNGSARTQTVQHKVIILDKDGKEIANFLGEKRQVNAGDTVTLKSAKALSGLHLWSWGYGYLYTVKSQLVINGKTVDNRDIRTGFRKTAFHDGMFYLNDRVLQLKGFAQRSTNEWPAVGISIPAWMSDYSNSLVLGCNGNLFRWMHVTPSKQDVESFDRLGLIQAMPAGDAEKDVNDRRWQHRCSVMRDAIIYNRNNPSIIFYEGGNNNISDEHMAELIAIRDKYDPNGGRAAGSRNMLDSKNAEYGGEMLYVNKSDTKPVFMMEYNRDEGIRRYWDEWSYPYHKEGEGPLYRGSHTKSYNHNMDGLAIENIVRWNEYWLARPGTGKRVNSGGAKIIFSDSNTHARGEKSYRTSGDIDAMRIPKDSYFAHKVMWNGWVDTEEEGTYIIGHWNYGQMENGKRKMENPAGASQPADDNHSSPFSSFNSPFTKPVYVCSTGDEVELFLNGKSLGKGKRFDTFLFTFDSVKYEPGKLEAVAYKNGKEVSRDIKETIGKPVALKMRWIGPDQIENGNSAGASQPADGNRNSQSSTLDSQFAKADGSDIRICEIEAVDKDGRRHPLAHDMLHFEVSGEGTYLGGVSGIVSEEEKARNAAATPEGTGGIISEGGHSQDTNGVGSSDLMLEAGVIRVMVRTTTNPGSITLTATPVGTTPLTTSADGTSSLKPASLSIITTPCPTKNGFYVDADGKPTEADRGAQQPLYLLRGETPATPSFTKKYNAVAIKTIDAAVNQDKLHYLTDGIEDGVTNIIHSKWSSDGVLDNAWLRITLERPAAISQIDLRMDNFRTTSYPLQVFAVTEAPSANKVASVSRVDGAASAINRTLIWEGYTDKCLGNSYLNIASPVTAQTYEIRMIGEATVKEAFASMTELAAKKNVSTKASKSNILSISEIEMKETAK